MSTNNMINTNEDRLPGGSRLCVKLSEEALKSNGTLWIDFFLPLLLKCRAGENFRRSLVKPLTLRPGEVNINHPSQVFIKLHQNFQ